MPVHSYLVCTFSAAFILLALCTSPFISLLCLHTPHCSTYLLYLSFLLLSHLVLRALGFLLSSCVIDIIIVVPILFIVINISLAHLLDYCITVIFYLLIIRVRSLPLLSILWFCTLIDIMSPALYAGLVPFWHCTCKSIALCKGWPFCLHHMSLSLIFASTFLVQPYGC